MHVIAINLAANGPGCVAAFGMDRGAAAQAVLSEEPKVPTQGWPRVRAA